MSGMDYRFRRKKHRLDPDRYVGPKTIAFTILVAECRRLFADPEVVSKLKEILGNKTFEQNCDVPIYCFMPDHLHILVRGLSEKAQPKVAVDRFKIAAGMWLKARRPDYKLHHDFYDHIVRSSEDWRGQAQYIALNPVRAGLTENPLDFEFTGCIGMNRSEMLQEIFFG